MNGIDVSRWQGKIDWNKVAANGIKFAIIRGGTGKNNKDIYFEENYKNAKAAGLKLGVYLYSYAGGVQDAKLEANFAKSLMNGKTFELGMYYDVEDPKILKKPVREINNIINTFMNEMKGYDVGIYTSKSYAENWGLDKTNYKIWIAQWGRTCTYKGKWVMWQYTSKGSVPGISGRVDLDVMKDEPAPTPKPKKSNEEIAKEVISGLWGNGEERKRRLTDAGYDYKAVQKIVNEMLKTKPKVMVKGQTVILNNNNLYASSVAKNPVRKVSGTYYIYDGISFKGRYRITNRKGNCGKKPAALYVTGYVQF